MIALPHNDRECLGSLTEHIAQLVRDRDPALVEIAQQHETTDSLADWLRAKPQRDDVGDPSDGPKVDACRPEQRFDLHNEEPNCFERSGIYLGAAELIDPKPARRLATKDTKHGLHTFPIEDGEPVILDPRQSRNALAASLFHDARTRNGDCSLALTPSQAMNWIAHIAIEPASRFPDGLRRARNAQGAMRGVMGGQPICLKEARDVAFILALADRESRQWGPEGPRIVATAVRVLDRLDRLAAQRWEARTCGAAERNALELRLGDYRVRPDLQLLESLGRIGGRIGGRAAVEALKIKLAGLGVSAPVLSTIESEMKREGLTLGPLATPPPMLGTFAALTPEAIAGRWLAGKL